MPSEVAAATPPEPVNGDGWFRDSADESADQDAELSMHVAEVAVAVAGGAVVRERRFELVAEVVIASEHTWRPLQVPARAPDFC